MKRLVLSTATGGLLVLGSFFATGSALAWAGPSHHRMAHHHSTHADSDAASGGAGAFASSGAACDNGGLLGVQLVCLGAAAIPVTVSALNHDNISVL